MEFCGANFQDMPFNPIDSTWGSIDKCSSQNAASYFGTPSFSQEPRADWSGAMPMDSVGRAAFSVMHANMMAQQANQAAGVAMSMMSKALLMNSSFGSGSTERNDSAALKPNAPTFLPQSLLAAQSPPLADNDAAAKPCDFSNVTTLMVRNIPSTVTQEILLSELDKCGFSGKFDFLYLPSSFHDGMPKGYAFINFLSVDYASRFVSAWHLSHRPDFKGHSPLNISPASIQGYEANVKKWNASRQYRIRNPNFRPFVLPKDGSEVSDAKVPSEKEVPVVIQSISLLADEEKPSMVEESPIEASATDTSPTSLAGCARLVFQARAQSATVEPSSKEEEAHFAKEALEQGDFVMKRVLRRRSSEPNAPCADSNSQEGAANSTRRKLLSLEDALNLQPSNASMPENTSMAPGDWSTQQIDDPGDWSQLLESMEESNEDKCSSMARDEISDFVCGGVDEVAAGSDSGTESRSRECDIDDEKLPCAELDECSNDEGGSTPQVADVPTPTFLRH